MKKILTAILVLLMMLSLVGCHGARSTETFEIPAAFDLGRNYEITFWAKNDSNQTQVEIYEQTIRDFEALYPNISVALKKYSDYSMIYNDVITNIATKTTPNVCITYPDHIATYKMGQNIVVPLDTLADDKAYGFGGSELRFDSPKKSEIVDKFLKECYLDGALYCLPYLRSTEACYVNVDLVEKVLQANPALQEKYGTGLPDALTWDYVWELSEAALEKNADGTFKANGQKVLIPFIYKSTDNMMISVLKQQDAGYSRDNGDVLIFNDTTRAFLYEIAKHAETRAFSTFKISSYPGNFLNAGQCIFAIDSTAGATWMGSEAPNLDIHGENVIPFNCKVMAIPQYDTNNPKMISQGPSICVFNKDDPQEVIASWLFAQFLLTNGVQIPYAQTEGYVPVTTKAQNSAEYQDYLERSGDQSNPDLYYPIKIDATKLLLSETDNTFVTPVYNGSADLRYAAGELIEEVTKARRRKITVDDPFLDNLFDTLASRYNLKVAEDAGPLPSTAIWLLAGLAAAWVLIGIWQLLRYLKQKKEKEALKKKG
ncbi:MAG: extracellular solute-binding protein [Lachnospiraceae bacterium]|nr:extracellular solute-binding protein [Lachnospiraceae bacterium]